MNEREGGEAKGREEHERTEEGRNVYRRRKGESGRALFGSDGSRGRAQKTATTPLGETIPLRLSRLSLNTLNTPGKSRSKKRGKDLMERQNGVVWAEEEEGMGVSLKKST